MSPPAMFAVAAASSSLMVSVGAFMSTACTAWMAAVEGLPAASIAAPAATSTVTSPSKPAVGVTTSVYTVLLTAVNVPLDPLVTVTSSAVKPVTASAKVKV